MVWPAIIAAGASIAGSAISAAGQNAANKRNISLAREQMAFQERMSNTQWQRGVEDMRKAGINPMLAVDKGGASSPAGATTTTQNALAGFNETGNSARAAMRLDQELDNLKAEEANKNEDTILKKEQGYTVDAQGREAVERTRNLEKQGKILDQELTSAKNAANRARVESEVIEDMPAIRKLGTILRELGVTGNSALGAARR